MIITLYEYYSVSNAANQTCTAGQICCSPTTVPTILSMFIFNFCWVNNFTYPVFAEANKSGNSVSFTTSLPVNSLVNYSNSINQPISGNTINVWYLTTDTQIGKGIIYQYNPSNTSQQYCYAMLIFQNTNNNSIYTGVVVNYSFTNSSLQFTQANVSNGANTKVLQTTIVGTNGESVASNYLGVCDLSGWFNSLTADDKAQVGTFNSSYTSQFAATGVTLPDPRSTIFQAVDGDGSTTVEVSAKSQTYYRYGSNWGATVISYVVGAISAGSGIPYQPFHF